MVICIVCKKNQADREFKCSTHQENDECFTCMRLRLQPSIDNTYNSTKKLLEEKGHKSEILYAEAQRDFGLTIDPHKWLVNQQKMRSEWESYKEKIDKTKSTPEIMNSLLNNSYTKYMYYMYSSYHKDFAKRLSELAELDALIDGTEEYLKLTTGNYSNPLIMENQQYLQQVYECTNFIPCKIDFSTDKMSIFAFKFKGVNLSLNLDANKHSLDRMLQNVSTKVDTCMICYNSCPKCKMVLCNGCGIKYCGYCYYTIFKKNDGIIKCPYCRWTYGEKIKNAFQRTEALSELKSNICNCR